MTSAKAESAADKASPWAPLGQPTFAVLWVATIISNVGTWMHDVGAGWLMTQLAPTPIVVAAVQAATTLPVFLFALPAGAIADIIDRRKLLIVVNVFMGMIAALLAYLVYTGAVTPVILLAITFAMGTGAAFLAPAWQAIVPQVVPRQQLTSAIALNSMGINVSRAIGPALAGFLIAAYGLAIPFLINALSVIGIIAALVWWRSSPQTASKLPPEHVWQAVAAGLRYARNSTPVRAALLRSASFCIFASAFWALLPLIARNVLAGGPTLYGILLGCLGAGAVLGAILLPGIRSRLGADRTVACGTLGMAGVLVIMALVHNAYAAAMASSVAGLSWIAVLSSLNVSAQTALPDWVRARGLSIFLTVFFGAMSGGSLLWGQLATLAGIPVALLVAASGAILMIPLTWRAKLIQGETADLTPSMHWPEPVVTASAADRGPVMVQVAYEIAAENRHEFVALMYRLAAARRRNGGFGWSLMQDAAQTSHFLETWYEASWVDHMRHHERVTGTDREVQERIRSFNRGAKVPEVTHFFAA